MLNWIPDLVLRPSGKAEFMSSVQLPRSALAKTGVQNTIHVLCFDPPNARIQFVEAAPKAARPHPWHPQYQKNKYPGRIVRRPEP